MPKWGIDDEAAVDESKAPERELLPEGDHDLRIREVHDDGDKVAFALAHDDKRYGWVFARVPLDAGWGKRILSSLRKSLGYERDAWAAMEITDLVDRRVRARIYHKAGTGRTFVNVAEFLPVEQAAAPAKPAARTATKKADAVGHDPDDIPFLWVLPLMVALSGVMA